MRVDVTWAGKKWTFDDVAVEVRGAMSLEDGGFRGRKITLRVYLGDAALLVSQRHHPRQASVRVESSGQLVLAGPVRSMVPGRSGELTELAVEELINPQSATIPSSISVTERVVNVEETRQDRQEWRQQVRWQRDADIQADLGYAPPVLEIFRVDETRIPTTFAERVAGRIYPIVIGRPGRNGRAAAPALPIEVSTTGKLMVAGHATTVGTVTVWGPKDGDVDVRKSEVFTTSIERDDRGQPITVVDLSTATILAKDWVATTANLGAPDQDWFVSWDGTASGLSGHPVDVLALLLAHVTSGISVDWASFEALRQWLAPYALDTVIASEVLAWDVLTRQVLPLLPVALSVGGAGVQLVPMRLDATSADARMHITVGPGFSAVSRPRFTSDGGEIINRWGVSYGPSRISGGFSRAISAAEEIPALARSIAVHGMSAGSLQTAWIYDATTADRVAVDLAMRRGVDRRTVQYAVDVERYGIGGRTPLELGMVVRVTHDEEHIDDVVALVWEIQYQGTRTDLVTLMLLED